MASLGMVFEQYPDDVIVFVTDPRTGIQRQCKFPPTISEIVEACDARVADLQRKARFENWGKNDAPMIEPPRHIRPSYDDLKTKYGENWGIGGDPAQAKKPPEPAPTIEQLQQFYARNPERVARLLGEQGEAQE